MAHIGSYNPNNHEPRASFDPLPPGWYAMSIVSDEVKETKDKESEYLQLVLEIDEAHHPEHKGRKVFEILNLWNKNQKATDIANRSLSSICKAVGHDGELENTDVLHGRLMAVKLTIEDKPGYEPKNRVTGYDSMEARFSAQAKPKPAAKAAATGGTAPWKRGSKG